MCVREKEKERKTHVMVLWRIKVRGEGKKAEEEGKGGKEGTEEKSTHANKSIYGKKGEEGETEIRRGRRSIKGWL